MSKYVESMSKSRYWEQLRMLHWNQDHFPWYAAFFVLLVPLMEEWWWRGQALPRCVARFGTRTGVALTAVSLDGPLDGSAANVITRSDGVGLLLFFCVFLYYTAAGNLFDRLGQFRAPSGRHVPFEHFVNVVHPPLHTGPLVVVCEESAVRREGEAGDLVESAGQIVIPDAVLEVEPVQEGHGRIGGDYLGTRIRGVRGALASGGEHRGDQHVPHVRGFNPLRALSSAAITSSDVRRWSMTAPCAPSPSSRAT